MFFWQRLPLWWRVLSEPVLCFQGADIDVCVLSKYIQSGLLKAYEKQPVILEQMSDIAEKVRQSIIAEGPLPEKPSNSRVGLPEPLTHLVGARQVRAQLVIVARGTLHE
jgi:hypothetical protein